MHPDQPRLLTTGELFRVGSFPDQYAMQGKWESTVQRIGNSVPPLFMRAIALHISTEILAYITPELIEA